MPTYSDFMNNFAYYHRSGINTIEDDICIPNDIFDRIDKLPLKSAKHKCFVFSCYALLLLTNSFDCKDTVLNFKNTDTKQQYKLISTHKHMSYYIADQPIEKMCVSNSQLKELWGYNTANKKLDYIIKNGGIMDKYALTEFFMKGYRHINYRADRTNGNYFKIPIDVMLYCTMIDDLKDIAFTIYSAICRASQLQENENVMLTREYIKTISGIGIYTISKYVALLERYNRITVYRQHEEKMPKSYPNIYTPIMELDDRHFSDYNSWF